MIVSYKDVLIYNLYIRIYELVKINKKIDLTFYNNIVYL